MIVRLLELLSIVPFLGVALMLILPRRREW